MRKASKSLCLELSYGDKYVAVLYESMKGDNIEVTIYETQAIMEFFQRLNGQEGEETNCKKFASFTFPNHKINRIKWGYLNKHIYASTVDGSLMKIDLEGTFLI